MKYYTNISFQTKTDRINDSSYITACSITFKNFVKSFSNLVKIFHCSISLHLLKNAMTFFKEMIENDNTNEEPARFKKNELEFKL